MAKKRILARESSFCVKVEILICRAVIFFAFIQIYCHTAYLYFTVLYRLGKHRAKSKSFFEVQPTVMTDFCSVGAK